MSQFGKSAEFDDIILVPKRRTLQGPFFIFFQSKDMKKIKSFLVPFPHLLIVLCQFDSGTTVHL